MVQTFGLLLSALRAAHGIGVVHRDLKPDNVMLLEGEGDGFSSIAARLRHRQDPRRKRRRCSRHRARTESAAAAAGSRSSSPSASVLAGIDAPKTAAGAIMGTPAYMAPEQIMNGPRSTNAPTSTPSASCFYEVLAGRRPFNGGFGEPIGQHLFEPPPPLTAMAKENNMPPRQINWPKVEAVVMRMLAKEPDDRYQDCAALQTALEEAWGQSFAGAEQDAVRGSAAGGSAKQKAPAAAGGRTKRRCRGDGCRAGAGAAGSWSAALASASVQRKAPRGAVARYEAAQKGDVEERRLLMEAIEAGGGRSHLPAGRRRSPTKIRRYRARAVRRLAIAEPSDRSLAEPLAAQEGQQEVGINSSDIAALRLRIGEAEAEASCSPRSRVPGQAGSPLAPPWRWPNRVACLGRRCDRRWKRCCALVRSDRCCAATSWFVW